MMRKRMSYLLSVLLGLVFVFSSVTKLVGLRSFGQTVEAFCNFLGLESLAGHGLPIAVLICVGELCLGLLSLWPRTRWMAAWLFPLVMVFFTWITWQNMTSLYGQVESCGCFGEVIHLTPAQTFWKNVVLLMLSIGLLASTIYGRIKQKGNSARICKIRTK